MVAEAEEPALVDELDPFDPHEARTNNDDRIRTARVFLKFPILEILLLHKGIWSFIRFYSIYEPFGEFQI